MSVCAKAGLVDTCLDLYNDMIDRHKIEPNAVIYSTILSACERCVPPRPQLALKILVEATAPSPLDGDDNSKNNGSRSSSIVKKNKMDGTINIVAYNAAISACARSGQWRLAMQLLKEMQWQQYPQSSNDDEFKSSQQHEDENEIDIDEDIDDNYYIPSKKRILHPRTITPAPDQVTYGTVMAACERSGNWHQVLKVARSMQEQQSSSSSSSSSSSTVRMDGMALTSALHACQQLGLADEALYYLDQMKLLKQEEEFRDGSGSGHVVRRRQKPPLSGPDAVAYRLAISACARARRSNYYTYFNDDDDADDEDGNGRSNKDNEANISNSAIPQQQQQQQGGARWEDGIRLLNEIEQVTGKPPDVVTYTATIVGCAEAGQWKEAFRLLKEMKTEYNIVPNVVTYSAVISACATASANAVAQLRNGSSSNENTGWYDDEDMDMNTSEVKQPLKAALALLDKMATDERLDAKPNIVTYNAAIRASAEGLDVRKAFELMKRLKEAELEPTIVTFGSLMTACERVGNVEGMSLVFRAMKAFSTASSSSSTTTESATTNDTNESNHVIKPNDVIYGAAISCCRKAGESERAFLLLQKMIRDGIQPNTATFNTAIIAQVEGSSSNNNNNGSGSSSVPSRLQSKQMDQALKIYQLMTPKEEEQQLQSQNRKRKRDNSIKSCSPNRHTYNILICALAANKRPADAEVFLRKMRTDGYIPDVDLFTATVTSYERTRNHLKALALMESMTDYGYDFYEVKLLDKAFKKAIKLANVVSHGLKR